MKMLEYYTQPGPMTDVGKQANLFEGLPEDVPSLCGVIQGVMLHAFNAPYYGVELSDERKHREWDIRPVSEMLEQILKLDDRPLMEARKPEKRLVGICRHFATMLCAILRYQGVPARARAGFVDYSKSGKYGEHWICEYWNADQKRWFMVDAGVDEYQREKMGINPYDVSDEQFLVAGKAWQLCRTGTMKPEAFGIFDDVGMYMVRGNLVQDLASLNKVEALPWDLWGLNTKQKGETTSPEEMALLDHVAEVTLAIGLHFSELRSLYQNDDRLRAPSYLENPIEKEKMQTEEQNNKVQESVGVFAVAGSENNTGDRRVVIRNVEPYRVVEPMFEGIRVILTHRGESYSPEYIQGISGAAFRFAGPCPCAPTCSYQMTSTELIKLLGYEATEAILGWKDDDVSKEMQALIPRIKDSIRADRPVLVWHAFTTAEWDVVAGFDDEKGVFLGRGSYAGLDDYAEAKQTRPQEATKVCPAFGATFIGEKTGKFDAQAAELAALREAVRHARDLAEIHQPGRPDLEGLRAYDRWVEKFRKSDSSRGSGDSYCYYIYRSTHRAASGFLREIAPRYGKAREALLAAADSFEAEADALDSAEHLLKWDSPSVDAQRNAELWPILAQARDHYAAAIAQIEKALAVLK